MHTVKHKLRHPVTLVATVLGLVALLSAAAFALPAETTADQAATTAPTVDQTAFHQASAARAADAFNREVRQDSQARRSEQYRLLAAHGQAEALRAAARERAEAAREAAEAKRNEAAAPAASSGRCGGNLPPCCVMQRESGGSLTAHNPSSSASGKWQFLDSTWNGYGGYASAADAPESVQDQKAAQLWAGGSGASHWGGGC